ncbi:phosphonate metabolism transcriptional regulator PhnF [Oceanibaculum pacificum]|uniref:Phosphonate metabolism transcriptional regulator PhnF n=1 Tax=Oceanibaculum pacificum TaxID=580166 RepID=A0A154W8I1_9PROT|nr:phosphonate metabolism transcriptional regulator PhnF [Oceanibaculum pacificum]KZD09848.1 phosphonate metabolism transcriptional regulator PhnF [Oceanibaculum pacificum]
MMPRKAPSGPVWQQIAESLADDIATGRFPPGSKLPVEGLLAERFQVNRHTLRRAMGHLAALGLVRVEQGRGSFVQEDVVDYMIGPRTRFSENISRLKRRPGGVFFHSETVPAGEDIAAALNIAPGAPCLLLETLNGVDDRVISYTSHYFDGVRFAGIDALYRELGSITKALMRLGVPDYSRAGSRITARLPDQREANLLKQARNRPILVVEAVNVTPDGRPVEYGIGRFASDRVQLVVE